MVLKVSIRQKCQQPFKGQKEPTHLRKLALSHLGLKPKPETLNQALESRELLCKISSTRLLGQCPHLQKCGDLSTRGLRGLSVFQIERPHKPHTLNGQVRVQDYNIL